MIVDDRLLFRVQKIIRGLCVVSQAVGRFCGDDDLVAFVWEDEVHARVLKPNRLRSVRSTHANQADRHRQPKWKHGAIRLFGKKVADHSI